MSPEAVAVVGASTDETKRGYQAIKTLQTKGYDGEIYPVNPSAEKIRGLGVYESVSTIPAQVDLALIVTPAQIVPEVLEDCGEKDIAGAVVIAVGFSEAGPDGERLEDEIVKIANDNDIRLIGPNTSGMINVHEGLNLVGADTVPKGKLALLCQSGNMAISLFTEAATREGVGFSHYVGVGNEADLQFHEYLSYLNSDSKTDAIICYIEGLSDGRSFLREARRVAPNTPILTLKSGRSDVGKRSASSHTGSLAGDSEVADAVFKQAGIINVKRSDELLSVANALSSLPRASGDNVAVLADGGGHATLAADALSERGLSIPELHSNTQETLQNILPNAASVVNPVDVAGGTDDDPSVFVGCVEALLNDPNVDALLLTGLFGGYSIRFSEQYKEVENKAAQDLSRLVTEYETPLVVQSAYEGFDTESHSILRENGIPVVESLGVATSSVEALAAYGKRSGADKSNDLEGFEKLDGMGNELSLNGNGGRQLSEYKSKRLLEDTEIPVTTFKLAQSPEEAEDIVRKINEPVAMKIVSPDIVHKSDIGGVALNVSRESAAKTYNELTTTAQKYKNDVQIDGVLISPMVDDGIELIVGVVNDNQFGPVVMFGLGGVFVEILEDVSFRALPLTEVDAVELINDINAKELLNGARGNAPVDKDSIVELLVGLSSFVEKNPTITELDLNPVIATKDSVEVVDAAITVDEEFPTNKQQTQKREYQ